MHSHEANESSLNYTMIIRKNILPKTLSDACSIIFILSIVPLIYWFEFWVVLPTVYEPGSWLYCIHFLLGNFLLVNIVGNFVYTVLCDTSTRQIIVPSSDPKLTQNWRLCAACESLAPPRSWHCNTCKVCILKRDHHCIFTGCCIGHQNHRYFLMFMLYMFIATLYCFFYNNIFIWNRIQFEFPMSILKIIFPLAIFVFGFDGSIEQFYLMLYIVTTIGMLFTGTLCIYHFNLVFNGCTAYEREKNIYAYNLGWRRNLKLVLGNNWPTAMLLPYVKSVLPNNGLSWTVSTKFEASRKRK